MKSELELSEHASLREKLEIIANNLPPTYVTLSEILESVGKDSLLFLTVFLALIFLAPVSIPGVSTVFGGAILLIGVARLFNRKLWLPERISKRAIASDKLAAVFQRALGLFRRMEAFIRPCRLHWITREGSVGLFNKLAYILAAVLLMMPFGFIPFSNTLPAIALIFLAVGTMQKDGGSLFVGHLANLATILYFAGLTMGGGMTLFEVWSRISF